MNSTDDFAVIAALDLDPIKVKLMHKESGEGWTLDQANAVEFEYRRFLYLMKKFPHEQTAPLFDVDTFWHYHILDTMKYAADCEQVFGYFLHHFPYIGLRGEDDVAAHHRVGERMRELYEETFGESYAREGGAAYSGAGTVAYSGAGTIAYSGAGTVAKTAYSGAGTVAYSGAGTVAKTAYSGAGTVARTAYSGAGTVAYSGAGTVTKTAYCGAGSVAKTAYSGAGTISVAAPVDAFYATRPTLAKAA